MGWNNSWQVPVSHLCEKMFAATSGLAQFVFTPFPPHCDLKMHDSGCLKLASPKAGAKEAISWKSFVLEQQSQREKRNVRKEGWSRWGMDTLTSAAPQVHTESLLGTSQGHLHRSPACLSKVLWKTTLWKSPSEGARGCVSTYSLPLPKVLTDCITLPLSTAEEVHTHALHLGTCCGRPHVAEWSGP